MLYKSLVGAALISISLGTIASLQAQTPQPDYTSSWQAQNANFKQVDFTLKAQKEQTFSQLIQQAELQATNLVEQEFAANPSVTEVAVNILGDRDGQQAPLLIARVSRNNWQQQPAIRQWTKYFATSAVLLGFNEPAPAPSAAPETPTTQRQQPSNSTVQPSSSPSPSTPPPSNLPASPNSSPNNSQPSGASLEESDPGYR